MLYTINLKLIHLLQEIYINRLVEYINITIIKKIYYIIILKIFNFF